LTAAAAAILTPPALLAATLGSLLDPSGRLSHRVGRLWALLLIKVSRVRVTLRGREHLEPSGTYVFAVNHTSVFDILVLMAYLPVQFRWVAKEELFHIPFFGPVMKRVGHIPINRSSPREGLLSLGRAAERIRAGTSVVIFPEGTRSDDGRVLPFKRGGFLLATRSGRPVVPVALSGPRRVLPPKTLDLRPNPILIALGPPVATNRLDRAGEERLAEQVRQMVIERLEPHLHGISEERDAP
jgi:1-acyl-sn-glycerol-3-phosphate acyltransferase